MNAKYKTSLAATIMNIDRANYIHSSWSLWLLILLIALCIGIWGDKLPKQPQSNADATRQTTPVNLGPSTAELIPIFSGNPGGSTSLGGGVSLGGGSHH
jgi:hypothetical protein